MRKNLIAILILACAVSGCASTARGPGASRDTGLNLDPARSKSCYGGPVYVPC